MKNINHYGDEWFNMFDAQFPCNDTIDVGSIYDFKDGVRSHNVKMENGLILKGFVDCGSAVGRAVYKVVERPTDDAGFIFPRDLSND